MPRGCALPGAQLQEETDTVSALASLTVDVEQPFAQEDSRYGPNMGESLRSVISRPVVNAHEPTSRLLFTCLLHFHHLSSPQPQVPQHMLSAVKNSFICFVLHGKRRAGACGCSSQRNGGDEIDSEKNHFLLDNLMQVIMERAALRAYLLSLVISVFPDVLFVLSSS